MRRGFTLVELVIVIGLIALVGGLIVINAEGILRGLGSEPAERILQKAIREARFQAASIKESAFLQYDSEIGLLLVIAASGQELASYPLMDSDEPEPPDLVFEQILPATGLGSMDESETYRIPQVVFRPDRSSTPFQVRLTDSTGSYTLRYDPFSSIVIHDSRVQ